MALSITRTKRDVKRLRLERSLLSEKLEDRTVLKVDDSDGSPSPPSSPISSAVIESAGSFFAKQVGGAEGTFSPRTGSPGAGDRDISVNGSPVRKGTGAPTSRRGNNRNSNNKDHNGNADTESSTGLDGDDTASTPVSATKNRRPPPRDPNLPKRPQNAYIIFCDLEKERVKREVEEANPGHPFDLTKAMAEKWHELTDTERQQFYQIYEDDKERYAREMVAYHLPNPSPSEQKEKQRAEKTLRDIEKLRKEGKRPPILSGSPLAKIIEATSGSAAAAAAILGVAYSTDTDAESSAKSTDDVTTEKQASETTSEAAKQEVKLEKKSSDNPATAHEGEDVEMKDT